MRMLPLLPACVSVEHVLWDHCDSATQVHLHRVELSQAPSIFFRFFSLLVLLVGLIHAYCSFMTFTFITENGDDADDGGEHDDDRNLIRWCVLSFARYGRHRWDEASTKSMYDTRHGRRCEICCFEVPTTHFSCSLSLPSVI